MPTTLFRGTRIRYCDLRQKEEAGVFVRLHLTSDYSGPVCDHFTWPSDLDESITNCKLAGELPAVSMVLTPNDPALMRHEIQLECRDLSDFQVVATKDDGEAPDTNSATSPAPDRPAPRRWSATGSGTSAAAPATSR